MDVIILNRRPTILHLPPVIVNDKNGEGRDRPRCLNSIPLTPGSTRQPVGTPVTAENWDRAKKHKAVKQWLDLGWVAVKAPDVDAPTDSPPPSDLSGYQGPAAIGMVETETNEATLAMWQKAESRQQVKDALAKRIIAVAKPRR